MKPSLAMMFPPPKDETDKQPMDGDGGSSDVDLSNIMIEIALNGYAVTYNYEDGSETKFVYTDFDEVLKQLRSKH